MLLWFSVHVHYIPGRDRQRPYHLELLLDLPPNSITRLSFEFDRALLKWTEYPPDANHGFYIGSAVVSTVVRTAKQMTAPPQYSSRLISM
jgi:phosphatidylinositol glycan class T